MFAFLRRLFPERIFRRKLEPAAERRLRLAQARAEEAIIRAHVDNALMFVDTLAEDLTFDRAIDTLHSRDGDPRAARQHRRDANTRRARPGSRSLPPPRRRGKRGARGRSSEASPERRLAGTRTAANDQARVALRAISSGISSLGEERRLASHRQLSHANTNSSTTIAAEPRHHSHHAWITNASR